jgi:voltage-gated potassium channel
MPRPRVLLYRIWDLFITLVATYAAFFIPLRLIPEYRHVVPTHSSEWFLTAVFVADIFVRLRQAREAGERFGRDGKGGERYLSRWFIWDLLAAIPFYLRVGTSPLQFLRLLKLARVVQFMRQWRQRQVKLSNVLRLAFFLFWFFLAAHWITCGWMAIRGASEIAGSSMNYFDALYWCITTVTTVGYGDVIPAGNAQKLYAMGVMLFGVGVYGYIIGNIATILANIDPAKANYLQNMERVTAFMHYRNIPPALRERIRDYYDYLWEKRLGYDESLILTTLPPSLGTEVSLFLKKDIIERVPLFKGASEEFIREIASQMTPVVFTPGDFVFRAGERGSDMYFITRGRLEVLSPDGRTILNSLSDGDFFGEIALFRNQPRSATVRAIDYCDLYRLDREMFDHVLAHYPDIGEQIESQARERYARDAAVDRTGGSPDERGFRS